MYVCMYVWEEEHGTWELEVSPLTTKKNIIELQQKHPDLLAFSKLIQSNFKVKIVLDSRHFLLFFFPYQ